MKAFDLSPLATAIATRRCALFAGAGLTVDSGGTWPDLTEFLKKKYGYSSPLKDNFEIIGDMCDKFGRTDIYNAVVERLKGARINEPVAKLMVFPWFTTFTTNYDLALETTLNARQKLTVRTILTGKEYALAGLQSEMLCVKLMGSLDVPDKQPGAMVLDPGDLAIAREERSRIFDMLASHAANLSFLFLGYSFNDNLFFEILQKLIKEIGKPKNTYYAVFREEPDEEKAYLLKQYNVEVIVSDLQGFSEELIRQVALKNPADYTLKRIPLGHDVVPIDSTNLVNFLSLYDPVFFEDLEDDVTPLAFIRGNTKSFKPFGRRWHYKRKEIKQIVDFISAEKNACIVTVEGNLGTGRTFTILASVYELITQHRALAVKIASFSDNKIPTADSLAQFIEEVERASSKVAIEPPTRIVFWAEFPLASTDISQFVKLVSEFEKYPISLLSENFKSSHLTEDLFPDKKCFSIDTDVNLTGEEKKSVAQYISAASREHRFPEITEEEACIIADQEKTFLPIMYRAFDPARRSINRIVSDEFGNIAEWDVKACISLCAIGSSVGIEMPIAVLRKALSKHLNKDLTYPETFHIVTDKAKSFLMESSDHRTNPVVSVYHPYIAQQLIRLIEPEKIREYLLNITRTIDLRSRNEAEFIGSLLIEKGVNWESPPSRPLNNETLKAALIELKSRQPARPIIHHLARLRFRMDRHDEKIIPLLEEALAEPRDAYALVERIENVLTTLAKIKWAQNKDRLITELRDNAEIKEIMALLLRARTSSSPNIHPYDLHAKVLKDLWQTKEGEEKIDLIKEAAGVIQNGLAACADDPVGQKRLSILLVEVISELDPIKSEEIARQLLVSKKDGTGYYALALLEYFKNLDMVKASKFLDIAINTQECPSEAIALKIKILLEDKSPDYKRLYELAVRLDADIKFQDTWETAYHKAVIFTLTGHYTEAAKYFRESHRMAPRILQRRISVFWMESGHRKVNSGKIDRILTEREGRIYSHAIEGWQDKIFFDPRSQVKKSLLQPGLTVNFELGFSPKGPIAFDVRPFKPSRSN